MAAPLSSQELSYRRITMKQRLKEFYKTGAKAYYGKKVHIYISSSVFIKKPDVVKRPDRKLWHVFSNSSVPVMVSSRNPYFKRLKRKLSEAKKSSKKIETVSVFGRIVQPSWDVKGRNYLLVYKIKTYGGGIRKIEG